MNLAINEVKTQAKILLKRIKNDAYSTGKSSSTLTEILKKMSVNSSSDIKLKHCLHFIALQLGFINWHHAQEILSGDWQNNNSDQSVKNCSANFGTFFYNAACGVLINEWFANYEEAKTLLEDHPNQRWLLPYKNQFIVVKKEYLALININDEHSLYWQTIQHDLVAGYNTNSWDRLAYEVIRNRKQ